MSLHYFEDFPPGLQYKTPARSVFEADIVNFVAISGLYEDLFCNIEWIQNESPIKGGRYAPIALLWAFAQGLTVRTGLYEKTFVAILGVDNNTGARGANVFRHSLLRQVLPGPNSPFKSLPGGADMRVAIRQTTRVGENNGLPVEDLGVTPNQVHRMTRDHVMEGNRDLIATATALL